MSPSTHYFATDTTIAAAGGGGGEAAIYCHGLIIGWLVGW